MKKKLLMYFLMLMLAFSFTACSDDEEDKKDSVLSSSGLTHNLYDYQVSIDGVVYQLPMWVSDFAALGWEYQGDYEKILYSNNSEHDCWTKDGMEIWTDITNFSINSTPLKDCLITAIEIDEYSLPEEKECVLANDIKLNVSSQDDIIAAYGEPTDFYENPNRYYMYYSISIDHQVISLGIDNETGFLASIVIENELELDGVDNTFNPEIPASIAEYVAPAGLGTDIFDTTFQLDDVVYEFPLPIQVLLANGFALDGDYSDYIVNAGWYDIIDVSYNGEEFGLLIGNMSEYATYAENCYVLEMESDSEYGPALNLVLPGGFKVGMTEKELIAALGDYQYFLNEYGDYKTYSLYEPDNYDYPNHIEFKVVDGVVTKVNKHCEKIAE